MNKIERIKRKCAAMGLKLYAIDPLGYRFEPLSDVSQVCQSCFLDERLWDTHEVNVEHLLAILPYTFSGDYGGEGALGIANRNVCRDTLGKHYVEVTAIYSDGEAAFRWSDYETKEEVRTFVDDYCERIERYPVIDDDELYRVEEDRKQEALESWAQDDLRRELEKLFVHDIDICWDRIQELDSFRGAYYDCGHDEEGGWYFDVEAIAKRIKNEAVAKGAIIVFDDGGDDGTI